MAYLFCLANVSMKRTSMRESMLKVWMKKCTLLGSVNTLGGGGGVIGKYILK